MNLLVVTRRTLLLTAATSLAFAACTSDYDAGDFQDPAVVESELELENGGLTMDDDAPMFGQEGMYADLDLADAITITDPMDDAEMAAMMDAPDAAIYSAVIQWGQIPGDFSETDARVWSGSITITRGAMAVRARRLERATDRILPRTDRRRVDFTSVTRPHRDGLRLRIVDPRPGDAERLRLRYEGNDGTVFERDLEDLVRDPDGEDVDDRGNRIVAVAQRRPVDVCDYGYLHGRWHKVAANYGIMLGAVSNDDGDVIGHVRGLFGARRNGNRVFFGKFIDRAGRFRGIFRGEFDNGKFKGRWLTRNGDHGALGGAFRDHVPGPRAAGHFLGRWAETSCNLRVGD